MKKCFIYFLLLTFLLTFSISCAVNNEPSNEVARVETYTEVKSNGDRYSYELAYSFSGILLVQILEIFDRNLNPKSAEKQEFYTDGKIKKHINAFYSDIYLSSVPYIEKINIVSYLNDGRLDYNRVGNCSRNEICSVTGQDYIYNNFSEVTIIQYSGTMTTEEMLAF